MNYLLAIDEGTSSTRARLYTESGLLVKSSQRDLTQHYPSPGWVEHDPEEIWEKTVSVLKEVTSGIDKKKILALGITNQRETTVIWDKETGQCLSNAIVWQDRRTQDFCESFLDVAETIQSKTGLRPDPYFSASKLHWLLENIPEAKRLANKGQLAFGTIDSFLIWRLTHGKSHATDVTNASRTLLYNIFDGRWDTELLRLFDIPESVLPKVLDSDAHYGMVASDILDAEIPITGVAGDQHAALIGQQCFSEGMVKATYGTGGFLLMNTGETPVLSKHQLLTTVAYRIRGKVVYGLEGSIYQAGTTVKWLRDELKLIQNAAQTESLAASLPDNGGVYFVPSFTGMGAPHWLKTSGAMIVGLSRNTNAAHYARAALECVSYQTRDVLSCMVEDSAMKLSSLRVDGGMTNNPWFLQHLASQSQMTVQKPKDTETTVRGAALLAGMGCGALNSLESAASAWEQEAIYSPEKNLDRIERDYAGWLNALEMLKQGAVRK